MAAAPSSSAAAAGRSSVESAQSVTYAVKRVSASSGNRTESSRRPGWPSASRKWLVFKGPALLDIPVSGEPKAASMPPYPLKTSHFRQPVLTVARILSGYRESAFSRKFCLCWPYASAMNMKIIQSGQIRSPLASEAWMASMISRLRRYVAALSSIRISPRLSLLQQAVAQTLQHDIGIADDTDYRPVIDHRRAA